MSSLDIATQAQAVLQAALATAPTPVSVVLGLTPTTNDAIACFMFHEGSRDVEHAGPGVIRRYHSFPINVLVRADQDQLAAETALLQVHDLVMGAFYPNRRLNGTASTSQIRQMDAAEVSKAPFTTLTTGGTYRQRWYVLEVGEDVTYTYG